jgi:hypothetical protein
MATLFKNIIPLETLYTLPKSFVHRLRDIKIKQLEEQHAQQQQQSSASPNTNPITNPLMNGTAIEDLLDELS